MLSVIVYRQESEGKPWYLSRVETHVDWLGGLHCDSASFTTFLDLAIKTDRPDEWLAMLDKIYLPCPFTGQRPVDFQVIPLEDNK